MSEEKPPSHIRPSFEEALSYLAQTIYGEVLAIEFRSRREAALGTLADCTSESEVWKTVGAIDAMDELLSLFPQK